MSIVSPGGAMFCASLWWMVLHDEVTQRAV